ncbi:MAG: phospholipase D-like domain-containing protein [Chlamydiota bacterium]
MKRWIACAAASACLLGCAASPRAEIRKQEIVPVVNRDYFPALMGMLGKSRKSVDFIQLEWHYTPETVGKIQDALQAAVKRGVRVRGLVDNGISFNPRSVEFLTKKFGVDAKLDTPEKMTHNKIFIVDGAEVLLGSTNLTHNSMERNNETNILLRDPVIAAYFEGYFEKLWRDSATEPGVAPKTSGAVTAFTNRSYLDEVLPLFAGAKDSIRVLMYGISYTPGKPASSVNRLVDALVDARARGVKVMVILDRSNYNKAINGVNEKAKAYLESKGVETRWDDMQVTSHAKLIIADGAVVVGSYNWGRDAMDRRNECALLVRDPAARDYFVGYFDTLWNGKAWPPGTPAPAAGSGQERADAAH